ncbi:histidine phosphatase family protein, partial [Mycobacterium sp. CBMA361]|nr:histidine phosphatase family protein [Mycolicibacterium sp. CBMA 361]
MINHTNSADATSKRRRARGLKGLGVALTAGALLIGSALPAWAAENMTITFIRH